MFNKFFSKESFKLVMIQFSISLMGFDEDFHCRSSTYIYSLNERVMTVLQSFNSAAITSSKGEDFDSSVNNYLDCRSVSQISLKFLDSRELHFYVLHYYYPLSLIFKLFKKAFFPLVLFFARTPILNGHYPYSLQMSYQVKEFYAANNSRKNVP